MIDKPAGITYFDFVIPSDKTPYMFQLLQVFENLMPIKLTGRDHGMLDIAVFVSVKLSEHRRRNL